MEVQPARQDSAGLLTPTTFHYIALFPLLMLLCTTEALPMPLLDDPCATHRVGHYLLSNQYLSFICPFVNSYSIFLA